MTDLSPPPAPSSPDGVALLSSRPMADHLSPAASAIVAAFNDRHELCGPFDGNWPELCLAAALRAAADLIQFKDQLGMTAYGGHSQAQLQLLAIAAELEDTNG